MKRIIVVLLFFGLIQIANAQLSSCDGYRYRTYVFPAYDSAMNVQYGVNSTMSGLSQNLLMDIYKPSGDTVAKRPLVLFIHGGGFVSGSRTAHTGSCKNFALFGYVSATIDYRLMDVPVTDSFQVTEGMIHALSDAKAAVRFFVEDAATANIYKIDTNNIFIAGLSAGGITASHLAYMDASDVIPAYMSALIAANGGFKGNSSSNTSYGTPVRGILNYSGGLWRKSFISAGEPALFSAHDSGDTIVPCNHGLSEAFPFPVFMDGACVMETEANLKGIYNDIFVNISNGHGAYFYTSPAIDTAVQKTMDFLYNIICNNVLSQNSIRADDDKVLLFPNPFSINTVLRVEISLQNADLAVYDVAGKLVRTVSGISGTEIQISKDDLQPGVYFIHLKQEKRLLTVQKMLVIE